MKKILLLAIGAFVFASGNAQTCTPDQNITQSGYYPSTLPDGQAAIYYEEVVQFNIPADTDVYYQGGTVNATIDSIKVISVNGLPAGLNYHCNPSSCALPGGQTSCGVIFGTPDQQASGNYPFIIPVTIYAKVGGVYPVSQKDTIFNLSMNVDAYNSVNIVEETKVQVFPRPAFNTVNFVFPESLNGMDLKFVDMNGKAVEVNYTMADNQVQADISGLKSGIYFGMAQKGNNLYRFRFVKN